jgi:hypothetical protein
MDFLLAFGMVLSVIVLGFGAIFACIAGYARLCRKGFSPPASVFLLLSAGLLGVFSCLLVLPGVVFSKSLLVFAVIFWVPAAVFAVALALMLWLLPHRNTRVAGARRPRFPFVAVGLGLIGAGVAFVLWAFWEGVPGNSPQLLAILAGCGSALIALGMQARLSSTVEEAIEADPRAPVLYLRPFMQEVLPFVIGKKSTHGRYLSAARKAITSGDDETDWAVAIRFEQYFKDALETQVGPFVALGNPEDYLPPEGAARTYSSDSEWMERVERLVAACSCMVAEAGISSNLGWELRYLRQQGLQGKLFILTPPFARTKNWFDRMYMWAMQMNLVSWDSFTKTMTACGYEVEGDPGRGSVLCFDTDGKSVIVKQGAIEPEEYVAAIRDYLEMSGGYTRESFERPAVADAEPSPVTTADPPMASPGSAAELPEPPVALPVAAIKHRTIWSRLRPSGTVVIVLLILGGIVGWSFLNDYLEKSRTRALKTFASQNGFKFTDGALTITDPDMAGTSLIDHMSNEGVAFNWMQGERNDVDVILFDYRYTVKTDDRKGGEDTNHINQTVAYFCDGTQRMPPFQLQEYSLWNAMGMTGAGEHVDIAGAPEFSKQFILQSTDKDGSARMFSAPLRSFLMKSYPRGSWHIEGGGECLMLYQANVRVKPADWGGFLEQTSQVAKGFFQNVGPGQGAQTAAPR